MFIIERVVDWENQGMGSPREDGRAYHATGHPPPPFVVSQLGVLLWSVVIVST
jgi:hypothetical protein